MSKADRIAARSPPKEIKVVEVADLKPVEIAQEEPTN